MNSAYDLTHTAHLTASVIDLTGINNGSCSFALQLLNSDASPADSTIFTLTQPTLTSDPLAIDPRIISVTADGRISIAAVNSQAATFSLILRVISTKNVLDTAAADVSFTINVIPFPCSQVITDPTIAPSTTYYITTPSITTTITFTGLSNTNCLFDTTLTLSGGTAIDTSVFTYTPEVVTVDPIIDSIY